MILKLTLTTEDGLVVDRWNVSSNTDEAVNENEHGNDTWDISFPLSRTELMNEILNECLKMEEEE